MMIRRFSTLSTMGGLVTLLIMIFAQGVWSLSEQEIAKIAESVTVRIDGDGVGSGVIVKKEGNIYTVVTNCHVISEAKGNDFIISLPKIDDQTYSVTTNQNNCEGKADLAELQFISNQTYQVAKIQQPPQLSSLMTIYVSGWVGNAAFSTDRGYRIIEGKISDINNRANKGYQIVHNAESAKGMSGGPMFNEEGELIGINGAALPETNDFFAIPINLYIAWRGEIVTTSSSIPQLTSTPSVSSTPSSQPSSFPSPTLNSNQLFTAPQWLNRGYNLDKAENYIEAINAYSQAIQLDPNLAMAYNNRGNIYAKQGKDDLALADYNQAIQVKPNLAMAYNNRGIIYQKQGKNDLALADYNKAIQLDPNLAMAYNNRGNIYFYQGKDNLALADYNQAIQVKPDAAVSYYNRGNIYEKRGQINLADADFKKARELGYSP